MMSENDTSASTHPTAETLAQVALGEIPAASDALGVHLAECQSCRAQIQLVRRIRLRMRDDAEAAGDLLLRRILEGEPGDEPRVTQATRRWPRARMWGIAASMVAAVGAGAAWWSGSRTAADAAGTATRSDSAAVLRSPVAESNTSFSVWPTVAYASDAQEREGPYPPIRELLPERIRPSARDYVRSSASAYHDIMPLDAFTIVVDSVRLRGERAWRVVLERARDRRANGRGDTTWLRRSDLRLLQHRFGYAGFSLLTRRVDGDSMQYFQTYVKRPPGLADSIVRKVDRITRAREKVGAPIDRERPLIVSMPAFLVLLRALPLHTTWRGSFQTSYQYPDSLRPTVPASKSRTFHDNLVLNVSVQGDSVVNTLWGHVPSWRVVLHTGANPERWYVSKKTGEVVLMTGPDGINWPRSRLDILNYRERP